MKNALFLAILFSCGVTAQAQSCEGGLYLNPQVIRGEGASQTESALKELVDFIRPTGLSVTPVLNIRETQDVLTAVKKPAPPCWVYGNPVVGLASGYRPVAVNMDPIQSAVLILADIGTVKDGKPVELKTLPPAEQAKVLAKLKTTSCFGMKSGVTTSLVKAENFCGTVVEILPQQGLGQSYLPTKAAFHWQADRWAGLITRLQSAQAATMKSHHGTDERIHMAQLVIVPASNASWGYGLYVHPSASADVVKKAANQFDSLKAANPLLLKALDLGAKYDFATPSDAVVEAMKKSLAFGP
ncbi:hypothetical protein [Polaromonas aquatica]|uniref:hypothetical protein n=1 Tax=Polaromonas aquatica TaxID=332657 RepID=UPI003D64CE65